MSLIEEIREDYAKYRRKRADLTVEARAIELAEATLSRLDGDLAMVLGENAHVDWTLHYIEQRQRELADGGDPLCTCNLSSCPLKEDQLPWTVRQADSLTRGIYEFRQEHPGTPTVLLDAREEWQASVERVRHHVATAHAILVQGTEPAGVDDDPAQAGEYPLPTGIDTEEELLA